MLKNPVTVLVIVSLILGNSLAYEENGWIEDDEALQKHYNLMHHVRTIDGTSIKVNLSPSNFRKYTEDEGITAVFEVSSNPDHSSLPSVDFAKNYVPYFNKVKVAWVEGGEHGIPHFEFFDAGKKSIGRLNVVGLDTMELAGVLSHFGIYQSHFHSKKDEL